MNHQPSPPLKLLTIAGSDSGGAAGLQADLRTWAVLGAYGMSVITAVTAQNSRAVNAVQCMSPAFVAAQLDAVLSDYGAAAIKTGFIGRADLIITISAKLQQYGCRQVVIDPVLVNHRGQPMFPDLARQLYISYLLPLAALLTPNYHEAAVLLNTPSPDPHDLTRLSWLCRRLHQLGARNVLLKGGRQGQEMVDMFYDGQQLHEVRSPRLETINTHGAGDTLAAAVCVALARGDTVKTAVTLAHQFTAQAIQNSASWQLGGGHGPVFPVLGNL